MNRRKRVSSEVKRRYPKEEFARRGDAIYEKVVRPHVKDKDIGKFAAIDIETGTYVINGDEMRAGNKLRAIIPDAQTWMVRIGYPTVHSIRTPLRREPR
jgi:hypothetical protein